MNTTNTTTTTTQAETFAERTCFCPGDCNCNAPAWMMRPVFCGCQQH